MNHDPQLDDMQASSYSHPSDPTPSRRRGPSPKEILTLGCIGVAMISTSDIAKADLKVDLAVKTGLALFARLEAMGLLKAFLEE